MLTSPHPQPRAEQLPKLGSSARALALKAVLKRATIPCVLFALCSL